MSQLHNVLTLFLSLLVEAMPFLLFGVILSSSLLLLVDEQKLITILPKNPFLGALVGSCIGFLFPVCECGNIPVARRLLTKGVAPGVAIAFLLAAPTINPVVIWSTWVAFRGQPEIVVLRVIFSLIIAVSVGCLFGWGADIVELLQPRLAKRFLFMQSKQVDSLSSNPLMSDVPKLLQSGTYLLGESGSEKSLVSSPSLVIDSDRLSVSKMSSAVKWQKFLQNVAQELQELGGMLVIGSAIAASIQVFVPREIVFGLGQSPITSILAMMLLAAIVSICSTVDAFFALSFVSAFSSGSLLAFLVFGPTIDIKALGLMLSIFKPKIIIYLFIIIAQLTFTMTFIYNYFFSVF